MNTTTPNGHSQKTKSNFELDVVFLPRTFVWLLIASLSCVCAFFSLFCFVFGCCCLRPHSTLPRIRYTAVLGSPTVRSSHTDTCNQLEPLNHATHGTTSRRLSQVRKFVLRSLESHRNAIVCVRVMSAEWGFGFVKRQIVTQLFVVWWLTLLLPPSSSSSSSLFDAPVRMCAYWSYMPISFDDELRFTPGVHQCTCVFRANANRLFVSVHTLCSFFSHSHLYRCIYLFFIWFYHVSHESAMMCFSNNRACLFHRWSQLNSRTSIDWCVYSGANVLRKANRNWCDMRRISF